MQRARTLFALAAAVAAACAAALAPGAGAARPAAAAATAASGGDLPADKRRWLRLPAGTAIDASDPDAWQFPPGTRLWKEFAHAGRRVETRYIERRADGRWRYAAYVRSADGSDATLAPAAGIAALPVAQAPGRALHDPLARGLAGLPTGRRRAGAGAGCAATLARPRPARAARRGARCLNGRPGRTRRTRTAARPAAGTAGEPAANRRRLAHRTRRARLPARQLRPLPPRRRGARAGAAEPGAARRRRGIHGSGAPVPHHPKEPTP